MNPVLVIKERPECIVTTLLPKFRWRAKVHVSQRIIDILSILLLLLLLLQSTLTLNVWEKEGSVSNIPETEIR